MQAELRSCGGESVPDRDIQDALFGGFGTSPGRRALVYLFGNDF